MPGNRKSIRLKEYDYTQNNAYFVTICANDRNCVFGEIQNGKMVLNDIGNMIDELWQKIPKKYKTFEIDEYCIMPNHIHGILNIVGAHPRVRPDYDLHKGSGQTHGSAPTLGECVQWFKTMSTNEYIRNVEINDWPVFKKRFWQRNYYDHIASADANEGPPDFTRMTRKTFYANFSHQNPEYLKKVMGKLF